MCRSKNALPSWPDGAAGNAWVPRRSGFMTRTATIRPGA